MNKTLLRQLKYLFLGIFLACIFIHANSAQSNALQKAYIIELNDDTINPVTAEYIIKSIDKTHADKAQCLIIKLDTPGGLLNSTRMIVKKMLTSPVPVIVYIAPSGSHAGSAGVFITYASHVAAMAPSTNIGAAHPVQMGPGQTPKKSKELKELRELIDELKKEQPSNDNVKSAKTTSSSKKDIKNAPKQSEEKKDLTAEEDVMGKKILEDTTAFIRAIAVKRNRNSQWAVESVSKSSSITDQEALDKGVIEIIAANEQELLEKLDGKTIETSQGIVTLQTKSASIEKITMDARQRFFNVLANPNIAYILLILGFYGLLFEITHPGSGVPGILGAIFLILGFYSMQTLPTNYAGLALLILGFILFIAEAYTPTFGLLTLGGIISLVLGSMLLFESIDPIMRVSKSAIFAVTLTTAGITLFLLRSVMRAHRSKILGGKEGLIGDIGIAETTISAKHPGRIFVHGESWNATSDEDIKKDDEVIVTEVHRLIVKVKLQTPSAKK